MLTSAAVLFVVICGITPALSEPPKADVDIEEPVYFVPGEEFILNCTATGKPLPKISWLFNGRPLDIDSQTSVTLSESGSLIFHSITPDYVGNFQCRAENVFGVSLSSYVDVREAVLLATRESEHDETVHVRLGHAAKLPCVSAESQPKGKVLWTRHNDDGTETTFGYGNFLGNDLDSSERTNLDYEGNLYILTTRPEDSLGWFVCSVTNEVLQSTITGSVQTLLFTGEYPELRSTELLWKSQTQVQAFMYDAVKLKCIMGGNPVPRVTWTHNDVEISSSGGYEISDDSFELTILELQATEIGRYQCIGNNGMSDGVLGIFNVSAIQKPYWISEPQSITVDAEEDVTLTCKSDGIPEPVISWFVNGIPIEETDVLYKNVEFLDDALFFTDVDDLNTAVFQCNASNDFGFAWADFSLRVQAEPPAVDEGPESTVKVLRGKSVRLPCEARGSPRPQKSWLKNGAIIKQGSRFSLSDNGDLYFEDADVVDEGSYSCVATNKFGRDEIKVKVIVQEKTRIIVPPVSKSVTNGEEVSFHCEAVTDYREQMNLNITWMKNNQTVDDEEFGGRLSVTADSLIIQNVEVDDQGLYTCIATSSVDMAQATAQLKVRGPPGAPYDVQIVRCRAGRADISWKFDKSLEHFSPVTNFTVQYMSDHRPGKWVLAAETPHHKKVAAIRLAPWTEYTFRVAAVSDLGRGKYSAPSETKCVTPMTRPYRNPRKIRKIANTTGFLIIEWAPIPKYEHNGEGFYYNVTVKEDGTKDYNTYIINNSNTTHIRIPVNTVFCPYSIMISSGNVMGPSLKAPRITKGYSGEAVPLVVPENFELDPNYPVTNTSARLQWNRVNSSTAAVRGAFKGYQISYWRSEDPEHKKGVRIPPNRSKPRKLKYTLHDLPANANVSVDIAVINTYFISNHSNIINFTTLEGVPGKVQYLFLQSRGSRYFFLEWKEPEKTNGVLLGYQIGYSKQTSKKSFKVALTFDTPNISRAFLPGLEPASLYKIAVWGYTQQGNGEAYYITAMTMSDHLPLAEPRVTKVISGVDSVTVVWQLDESVHARAPCTYHVEYRRVGNGKWQRVQEEKATDFKSEIPGLDAQATYYVVVVGEDDEGNSVRAKQSLVSTMPESENQSSEELAGSGNGTMVDYDFDQYEDYETEISDKTNVSDTVSTGNSSSRLEENSTSLPVYESNTVTSTETSKHSKTAQYSVENVTVPTASLKTTSDIINNSRSYASETITSTTAENTSFSKIKIPVTSSVDYVLPKVLTASVKQESARSSESVTDVMSTEKPAQTVARQTTFKSLVTTRSAVRVHSEIFTVTLKPNGRPSHRAPTLMDEESTTVVVTTGEALDLTCKVEGYPVPAVTWLRKDIPLVSDGNVLLISHNEIPDSRLILLKTDENSAGFYKCVAENYLGLTEQKYWVMLKEAACPLTGSQCVVSTYSVIMIVFGVIISFLV